MSGRWIVWTLLAAVPALLTGCCDGDSDVKEPVEEVVTEAVEEVTEAEPADEKPPHIARREAKETPRPDARDVDQAVSKWIGAEFGGGRQEDVAPDGPYRIDLIQDEGAEVINAVEVDLDRDGNWDERWAIEGASVTREVSPDDDGEYSRRFAWIMQRWVNT